MPQLPAGLKEPKGALPATPPPALLWGALSDKENDSVALH